MTNGSNGSGPGLAILGGMLAGGSALLVALLAAFSGDYTAAGICLAAAGLAFGLLANAFYRS